VEADNCRAQAAGKLLSSSSNVAVIHGDWQLIRQHAPFDFLFVDAGPAKQGETERLFEMLAPGGFVVFDDMTPRRVDAQGPWIRDELSRDPVRRFWLQDDRVAAAEVVVRPSEAVIIAARRR